MAGIRMNHIPYKGTGPALTDTISGQTNIFFSSTATAMPHVKSGRLRAIAVTTAKRIAALPEVPTVAESGVPGYEVDQWYGVITSSSVPKPIVRKLNAGIVEALRQPDVATRLAADGSTPIGSSPEQFNAHIKSEIAKWQRLVKEANLRFEK
jgi:tripartite-type tricarboxylate transporter receptor subunit TctC